MKKERVFYMDYLRVLAATAVIMVHVAAQDLTGLTGRSPDWHILNVFNSAGRWCVAVFVMISGALFLSREIEIGKLYKKYISRVLCAYLAWSAFYALAIPLGRMLLYGEPIVVETLIDGMVWETYHLWFLPMIIGFYMCVPLIRQIVKSEQIMKYYLVLSFLFAFVIPQTLQMSHDFIGGGLANALGKVNEVMLSNMHMDLLLGFSFYAVLGYWLDNVELSKNQRRMIYALGVLGLLATILFNALLAWRSGEPCYTYYDHFTVNVALQAVAVHTLVKYRRFENEKRNRVMAALSRYSFGAYLIHIFVMSIFSLLGITVRSFMPLIATPIMIAVIFVGSFTASFIISKIPVLNKWIV